MGYFSTHQLFLMPSFGLDQKEQEKLDRFLRLLDNSGVAEILSKVRVSYGASGGRPPFNRYNMFATVLYGFAFGSCTLRDLEAACRYDLRFIYLMEQERPTYSTFEKYINEFIVPYTEEIFSTVNKEILKECGIGLEDVFLDGTKIEADANKYKFVWKPTTWHAKLCDKVRTLLKLLDLDRGVPSEGIFNSSLIAAKLTEFDQSIQSGTFKEKKEKVLRKQYEQMTQYLLKALEYEEKERICGPNRKSYYKTDHDATAMCLKEDYYSGAGSNMHAAYSTQAIVSKGFVCAYYVSQARSDYYDFIPALQVFYRIYGRYPKRICADSGYGIFLNYQFLADNNIENFVKYPSWEGNVSGRYPDQYHLNDDLTITCLNGHTGNQVELPQRHPKHRNSVFYRVDGCAACAFSPYCKRFMTNKNEDIKIFEVNVENQKYKNQVTRNLLSPKGIEMRVNRSAQIEGTFGMIKQDMNYTRFRRISLERVTAEFMLTILGLNIRKLFRFFEGKVKIIYWTAPQDLKPQELKKPSAKKLAKKAVWKKRSVNEEARNSIRY